MKTFVQRRFCRVLTYVEVLIANVLVAVALALAVDVIHTDVLGSEMSRSTSDEHFAALALLEEVLAETRTTLVAVATATAIYSTPSTYSDVSGASAR